MASTEINKINELCGICRSLPEKRCSKKESAERIWQMVFDNELSETQGRKAIGILAKQAAENGCKFLENDNFYKSRTEVRELE